MNLLLIPLLLVVPPPTPVEPPAVRPAAPIEAYADCTVIHVVMAEPHGNVIIGLGGEPPYSYHPGGVDIRVSQYWQDKAFTASVDVDSVRVWEQNVDCSLPQIADAVVPEIPAEPIVEPTVATISVVLDEPTGLEYYLDLFASVALAPPW